MADLPALAAPASPPALSLDDLPVLASVTARWPLEKIESDDGPTNDDDLRDEGSQDFLHAAHNSADEAGSVPGGDDETQEMDVLLQPEGEKPAGADGSTAHPAK